MDDSEGPALVWLIQIAVYYETTARALLAMEWVADGVSDTEQSAIFDLWNVIASLSAAAAESLIALPWLADGVSDTEAGAITELKWIAEYDLAENIIALPWVADGVSDNDKDAIFYLRNIASRDADAALQVVGMQFIQTLEGADMEALHTLVGRSADELEELLSLPTLKDGITDDNAPVIALIGWEPDVVDKALALTWVADGVSDSEASAVFALSWITYDDVDAAMRVMDMPFLQTLEGADAAALRSLGYMDADQLADMLSRPMLKDGITDDEAPIVSMLYQTLKEAPNRVDRLLDPDTATVERRTVELPLAGEADLAIVRTRPGAKRSIDLLENAVQEAENLMGEPLPTRYVGLLFENATSGSAAGTNFGTSIVIRPEYDAGEGSAHIIAHEVAHYYWNANADWIDEGMAELTASAIENRRVGTPINVTNSPCGFVQSLKDLEELAPERGEDAFICNYSLGERLFISLLWTLGEDAFWEGARRLYAASLDAGGGAGVEEVRQAFGANVGVVIDRWYEGN